MLYSDMTLDIKLAGKLTSWKNDMKKINEMCFNIKQKIFSLWAWNLQSLNLYVDRMLLILREKFMRKWWGKNKKNWKKEIPILFHFLLYKNLWRETNFNTVTALQQSSAETRELYALYIQGI